MHRMIKTRSAKKLPLDMADNAEVVSKMCFITRSAKNLSVLVDIAEDAEFGEGDGDNNEMVKRSLSKNSNVPTGYLNSLRSKQK